MLYLMSLECVQRSDQKLYATRRCRLLIRGESGAQLRAIRDATDSKKED